MLLLLKCILNYEEGNKIFNEEENKVSHLKHVIVGENEP